MSRIVTRDEWGHPGPLGPPMSLPAQRLYVHHSVTEARNGPPHEVARIGIRRFGRSSYSYAVTPDGAIYEMQGTHTGAHTRGQNSTSLAAVLVGNYEHDDITDAQIGAVAWLHRHLAATGALVAAAPTLGHRDAPGAATACPGRNAYDALPRIRRLTAAGDPAPDQEDDVLKRGDRGAEVTVLQWRINQGHPAHPPSGRPPRWPADPRGEGLSYGCIVDGVYGEQTEAFVRDLQARWGYHATGVYDLPTAVRLLEVLVQRGVIVARSA